MGAPKFFASNGVSKKLGAFKKLETSKKIKASEKIERPKNFFLKNSNLSDFFKIFVKLHEFYGSIARNCNVLHLAS